jgi:hypothetical protein
LRWGLRVAGVLGVLVSIVWLVQLFVLPGVVRQQVRAALEKAGSPMFNFT